MNRKSSSVLLLVTVIVLAVGWGCTKHRKAIEQYGVAYNSERITNGIPIIPSSWSISYLGDCFDCVNEKADRTKPHRLAKRVFLDKAGVITQEEDRYYSGKSFYDPSQQITLPEEIALYYDYAKEKTANPWRIYAHLGPDRRLDDVSLEEADRLLASWGLSRTRVDP